MQTALKVLVAIMAFAVAWHVGRSGRAAPPSTAPANPPASQPTVHRSVPQDGQFRGLAMQLHGGTGVFDTYRHLIPQIANLGADTVLFVVHGWQEHGGSMDLRIDGQKTANVEEVGRLCDLARDYGLRRILMPIVLLTSPRNGEWRGKIIPADRDWDNWFKRYTQFILHFAQMAERHRVEVFMVGSELIKTELLEDRWRKLIEEVRQSYHGKLGYSANWDHYQPEKIAFWPQLDYVGMTSYYELAEAANPAPEEIDENWAGFKSEILDFQQKIGKPIIFTEVGWCSQEGAAHEGWNYYANQTATEAGRLEQARLYEAFLRNWADEPGVGGIIWWEWDTTAGGNDDYGYTPRGKPAEQILRRWFTGEAPPTTTSSPSSSTLPCSEPR